MSDVLLAFFIGIIIIIMGIILFYFPPKSNNKWDGYQSPSLTENPHLWKDVQKYYACNIIYFGVFFTLFGCIFTYFVSNFSLVAYCVVSLVFLMIIQVFLTEKKIKQLKEKTS